jgi:predicted O-linked N-acetylglucosamine transferase (SPINDLY family)
MEPAQIAELVRSDAIDILVDLGGHTADDFLRVFARKPAPVQVTWLGYPNTTGLAAMDYRLTDALVDPAGTADEYHSEALVRLSGGFLCYLPPHHAPPVSPSPAAQFLAVTFGSFNTLQKITPEVVDAWTRILIAVPGSRLLLKRAPFRNSAVANRYRQMFQKAGIESDRVLLQDQTPSPADHLAQYSQIDVALDTFPYNGTTTTCEALWMGVPVICLAGNRHAGRVGASLLSRLGMADLIAGDFDDYVQVAVALANDPTRLAGLRTSLRSRMAASSLCDAAKFARSVEAAYRAMWQKWCES